MLDNLSGEKYEEPIMLAVGYDPREAVGLHVFLESVFKHTTLPVLVTFLTPKLGEKYGIKSDGTNSFSTLRFILPKLYAGFVIFADGIDMMLRADLAELWRLRNKDYAVQVVKHDYRTAHPRKYIGTMLEADNADYPRKNWSSLAIWNCNHVAHYHARDKLLGGDGKLLHRFGWLQDDQIGELPAEWNHLVGEQHYNPDAKLVHFTLGLPGFEHYRRSDYASEWTEHLKAAARGLQYLGR